MKLRALLINPWICDFAAYNLWACPLGLYRVAEFLSDYDIEMDLIDCTAAGTIQEYGKGRYRREVVANPAPLADIRRRYKRYGIGTDDFVRRMRASGPYDFVLVTSLMTYWYPGVQKAIELVRDTLGDVPVLLGGIYATLCGEHAARYSGADYVHAGPVERGFLFALSTFGFRPKRRKASQPRSPAPQPSQSFAPLLTSRGCPFRCSYCSASLLNEGFVRCSPALVLKEIAGYSARGISDFAFYDDALLVDPDDHIKPILRGVQSAGIRGRFHTPNGLHARYLDFELAGLMRKSGFRTIRLSLETVDAERLDRTGGKVRRDDVEAAVENLRARGFTKQEIGVYLMYGLPGQGLDEVREGVRFLEGLGVTIHLTEFSPIKGTRCWDDLVRSGVIPDDLDPLLTNNTIFSSLYSGYDPAEIADLKLSVKRYNGT